MQNHLGMSCDELTTLIAELGSPPVNVDSDYENTDVAIDGTNCTNT